MRQITFLVVVLGLSLASTFAQSQLTPAIVKRIADHTPQPLPQTTKPLKAKSDAEDENLKGRIKTLVTETEYLTEDGRSEGRHFRSIVDFNERGDRIKSVYFSDNGNPYEVSTFGYIEGARVSSFITIYEDSGVFSGGAPAGEEREKGGIPDPRYNYRYVYQYSGGKLANWEIFQNDGTKSMSYVYNRSGGQIEELVYSSNGKLNQKYITVLDSEGNEIETRDIAVINLPRADRIFRVATDARDQHGNWTKRTFFKVESDSVRKLPYRMEYQTITYFPQKSPPSGKSKSQEK